MSKEAFSSSPEPEAQEPLSPAPAEKQEPLAFAPEAIPDVQPAHKGGITRRQFLVGLGITLGSAALGGIAADIIAHNEPGLFGIKKKNAAPSQTATSIEITETPTPTPELPKAPGIPGLHQKSVMQADGKELIHYFANADNSFGLSPEADAGTFWPYMKVITPDIQTIPTGTPVLRKEIVHKLVADRLNETPGVPVIPIMLDLQKNGITDATLSENNAVLHGYGPGINVSFTGKVPVLSPYPDVNRVAVLVNSLGDNGIFGNEFLPDQSCVGKICSQYIEDYLVLVGHFNDVQIPSHPNVEYGNQIASVENTIDIAAWQGQRVLNVDMSNVLTVPGTPIPISMQAPA